MRSTLPRGKCFQLVYQTHSGSLLYKGTFPSIIDGSWNLDLWFFPVLEQLQTKTVEYICNRVQLCENRPKRNSDCWKFSPLLFHLCWLVVTCQALERRYCMNMIYSRQRRTEIQKPTIIVLARGKKLWYPREFEARKEDKKEKAVLLCLSLLFWM